ncbi:hypothetical protein INT43_002165 [Umbelopsis isabellina]|uniref:Thiol-specific monooxygenase n=1 Tax=Mortierella isabellina TaxID=91625 RepID=A0A8H7Q5L6_MORIS|nr:hypothetical protein INT43_002165 [Umbelopsis isabellina]
MGYQEEENLTASDELITQIDKENTVPKHTYEKYQSEQTVKSIPSYISPVHFASNESLLNKHIDTVAVVGAGPAGLPTAKWLKEEGLTVRIFERNHASGGTWIYGATPALDPQYPSEIPSVGAQATLPPQGAVLPYTVTQEYNEEAERLLLHHTPPNPCYESLGNNVATPLLKYKDLEWPKDTPWFTGHQVICQYLQDYSTTLGLTEITEYNTSVERIEENPDGQGWRVLTKTAEKVIKDGKPCLRVSWKEEVGCYITRFSINASLVANYEVQKFDAVVVATGHYHVPYVPDFPGLREWHASFPSSVSHSKSYRVPQPFKGKNVLVIGNGTSAIDIMRDIAGYANNVYHSIRESHHNYDEKYLALRKELSSWIPSKVQHRVGIKHFLAKDNVQNSIIEFVDGEIITDIDHIIICTGYMFNFHFLENLHSDEATKAKFGDAAVPPDDRVLVKSGGQIYNLHKDIFYIPNPTLSFVGVPFHIATFSFFEFQALAVARAYGKRARLPDESSMRAEWNERLKQKGDGREFHALGAELEQEYIQNILAWLNRDGAIYGAETLKGHESWWFEVKKNALPELRKKLNI